MFYVRIYEVSIDLEVQKKEYTTVDPTQVGHQRSIPKSSQVHVFETWETRIENP